MATTTTIVNVDGDHLTTATVDGNHPTTATVDTDHSTTTTIDSDYLTTRFYRCLQSASFVMLSVSMQSITVYQRNDVDVTLPPSPNIFYSKTSRNA